MLGSVMEGIFPVQCIRFDQALYNIICKRTAGDSEKLGELMPVVFKVIESFSEIAVRLDFFIFKLRFVPGLQIIHYFFAAVLVKSETLVISHAFGKPVVFVNFSQFKNDMLTLFRVILPDVDKLTTAVRQAVRQNNSVFFWKIDFVMSVTHLYRRTEVVSPVLKNFIHILTSIIFPCEKQCDLKQLIKSNDRSRKKTGAAIFFVASKFLNPGFSIVRMNKVSLASEVNQMLMHFDAGIRHGFGHIKKAAVRNRYPRTILQLLLPIVRETKTVAQYGRHGTCRDIIAAINAVWQRSGIGLTAKIASKFFLFKKCRRKGRLPSHMDKFSGWQSVQTTAAEFVRTVCTNG